MRVNALIKKLSEFPADAEAIVVVDGAPKSADITMVREFGAAAGEHRGFPGITVIEAKGSVTTAAAGRGRIAKSGYNKKK